MEVTKELVPEDNRKPVLTSLDGVLFGQKFTDHMVYMEYNEGRWGTAIIKQLDNFSLHPGCLVFHYAQEIFEGAKCFQQRDGKLAVFRIDRNIARFNRSAKMLCMPQIDPEYFDFIVRELIKVDARHVPTQDGCSLYIRPFMISVDAALGVRASKKYIFCIIMSPVGAYYPTGFKPTSIFTSSEYTRVALRSTGEAKCGGNYAASLFGATVAAQYGCSQMLWLDPVHRKYVEEVGAMNCFFVKNGVVYTSPLSGSILPGITRASVIELCSDADIPVKEEALDIDDVCASIEDGTLTEIFGTGTAAAICPVGTLVFQERKYSINEGRIGPITQRMYDAITRIQRGLDKDQKGWITYIE